MNKTMVVRLEWDKDLGECWMNIDNLNSCLFSEAHTKRELLSVVEVAEDNWVYPRDPEKGWTEGEVENDVYIVTLKPTYSPAYVCPAEWLNDHWHTKCEVIAYMPLPKRAERRTP